MKSLWLAAVLLLPAAGRAAVPVEEARVAAQEVLRQAGITAAFGDFNASRSLAAQAAALDPRDPRAYLQKAVAANRLGSYAAAASDASRALALGYRKTASYTTRAEAFVGLGDFEAALVDAEQAIRASPESAAGYRWRAEARRGLGEPASAVLEDLRRAAELDPRYSGDYEAASAPASIPSGRGPAVLFALLCLLASSGVAVVFLRRRGAAAAAPAARAGLPLALMLGGRAGRLSAPESLRLIKDLCASAAALHDRGLAAGGIHPGAVWIDAAGASLELEGGSPSEYQAPETASGGPSRAADLFALGAVLYEMVTGASAFQGADSEEDKRAGRFKAATERVPELPVGVDAFFRRALDPDPLKRFHAAAELHGAFRAAIVPPVD
ncbi:MAG: tetratricopeptide repeat protein [Elusimicrobiota bacterium]